MGTRESISSTINIPKEDFRRKKYASPPFGNDAVEYAVPRLQRHGKTLISYFIDNSFGTGITTIVSCRLKKYAKRVFPLGKWVFPIQLALQGYYNTILENYQEKIKECLTLFCKRNVFKATIRFPLSFAKDERVTFFTNTKKVAQKNVTSCVAHRKQ